MIATTLGTPDTQGFALRATAIGTSETDGFWWLPCVERALYYRAAESSALDLIKIELRLEVDVSIEVKRKGHVKLSTPGHTMFIVYLLCLYILQLSYVLLAFKKYMSSPHIHIYRRYIDIRFNYN